MYTICEGMNRTHAWVFLGHFLCKKIYSGKKLVSTYCHFPGRLIPEGRFRSSFFRRRWVRRAQYWSRSRPLLRHQVTDFAVFSMFPPPSHLVGRIRRSSILVGLDPIVHSHHKHLYSENYYFNLRTCTFAKLFWASYQRNINILIICNIYNNIIIYNK